MPFEEGDCEKKIKSSSSSSSSKNNWVPGGAGTKEKMKVSSLKRS